MQPLLMSDGLSGDYNGKLVKPSSDIIFYQEGRKKKVCSLFQVNLAAVIVEMRYWQVAGVTLIGAKKATFHVLVWLDNRYYERSCWP